MQNTTKPCGCPGDLAPGVHKIDCEVIVGRPEPCSHNRGFNTSVVSRAMGGIIPGISAGELLQRVCIDCGEPIGRAQFIGAVGARSLAVYARHDVGSKG